MDSNVKLNRIQKNVYKVISIYPDAANNDALLTEKYWRMFCGWNDSDTLINNLKHSTRPETIMRRRRELFSMGLIHYSENKFQERMDAYKSEKIRPKVQANLFKFWSKQQ